MAEYQLKWTSGRLGLERKTATKNDQNFDEKCEILDFAEIDPESKNTSKINDFRQKKVMFVNTFLPERPSVGGALGDTGAFAHLLSILKRCSGLYMS